MLLSFDVKQMLQDILELKYLLAGKGLWKTIDDIGVTYSTQALYPIYSLSVLHKE